MTVKAQKVNMVSGTTFLPVQTTPHLWSIEIFNSLYCKTPKSADYFSTPGVNVAKFDIKNILVQT